MFFLLLVPSSASGRRLGVDVVIVIHVVDAEVVYPRTSMQ